jgi:TRAP-type mannitol/chloroaromatic compound transport system substrate-binding protein
MRRRTMLASGPALAAAALASPALAQGNPAIRWRLVTGYPRSIDVLFGVIDNFARAVSEATDGKFAIQTFAGGEIVPALQAVDAVANGTVEMAHTSSYYYLGKNPMYAPFTGLPFLMNARQHNAWLYFGGGNALADAFYATQGLVAFPAGNSGAQMGGWFRKEINGLADLQGLKFRVAGLVGSIYAKLGVVPQLIAPGDSYPALERGTIDAADWVGPHDDEKLGFVRVAPYYYYPGFMESSVVAHVFINKEHWDALPSAYKSIVRTAAMAANLEMVARYDAVNPPALRRLIGAGAKLRVFNPEIISACYRAANEVYAEIGARSPEFTRVLAHMQAFRDEQMPWWQISEYAADGVNIGIRGRNRTP